MERKRRFDILLGLGAIGGLVIILVMVAGGPLARAALFSSDPQVRAVAGFGSLLLLTFLPTVAAACAESRAVTRPWKRVFFSIYLTCLFAFVPIFFLATMLLALLGAGAVQALCVANVVGLGFPIAAVWMVRLYLHSIEPRAFTPRPTSPPLPTPAP